MRSAPCLFFLGGSKAKRLTFRGKGPYHTGMDKENLKKGVFLVLAMVAMGVAVPFMMGNQEEHYFMIELPNGRQILAQVADSPEKQIVGLYFTESLSPDQGYLMVFDHEAAHSLWTKNTHFPVDILWLDRDRRILHVQENAPPCPNDPCPVYGPERPEALYVLQAAGGFVQTHGLKPGMDLIFRLYQGKA